MPHPALSVPAFLGLITCGLAAQTPLMQFVGKPGSRLGHSVAPIADLNGDGHTDYVIGMPHNNGFTGSARLFCGRTGTIIRTVHAATTDQQVFGWAVCSAGDLDGDGVPEFAVGAPDYVHNGVRVGSVGTYSGRTGQRLRLHTGDGFGDLFGNAVANAGDVNADGFDDVIVGAPENGAINGGPGYGRVLSGKDGAVLYTFPGTTHADEFGINVAGAGDVNRDGHADLLIGSSLESAIGKGDGSVRLFSGKDGALMHEWFAEAGADHFGIGLAAAGDLDGDGVLDVWAGSPNIVQAQPKGYVQALSGRTGAVLYTVRGGPDTGGFGMRICATGDIDGDSVADFAVGGPGSSGVGVVELFSGVDGAPIGEIRGEQGGEFLGCGMTVLGDINDDGEAEIMIGSCGFTSNGSKTGRAQVFSLRDAVTTLPGCPGNAAKLQGDAPKIGQTMTLAVRSTGARRHGCLLISTLPAIPAAAGDCLLYLDPTTATANVVFQTSAGGAFDLSFTVPSDASLIGARAAIQAVVEQPGPRGYDLSNGLYVTLR